MPFVPRNGTRLYWKLEGCDGAPPLVLLSSIGTDMDLWAPLLPTLRRSFRLLRLDTRGHGASEAPPGDYSLSDLAQDVGAVMDAAGVGPAAVIGVSLGGMIAMQLALDAPERIGALVLICTSATMDPSAWNGRIETVLRDGMAGIADLAMERFLDPGFAAQYPEIAATVRRGLLQMEPHGYIGCAAAIRDMMLVDRLDAIRAPALVITGSKDVSTPLSGHGEHLLAGIPNAAHAKLGCAHLAPLEAPGLLAQAITTFLTDREKQ